MPLRQFSKDMVKRDAIIKAATALFLSQGFGGTSMEEIAKVSGVAKQTLYSHFQGKDALFCAIIHARSEAFFTTLPSSDDRSLDTESYFRQVGTKALDMLFTREALQLYRVVVAETPRFPDLGRYYWQAGAEASINLLSDFLIRRGTDKEVARAATEQFLCFAFGTLLSKTLLNDGTMPDKRAKDRSVDNAITAFFALNRLNPTAGKSARA